MKCKYTYKGKEYSEPEILKIIMEEYNNSSISPGTKEKVYQFINSAGFNVVGLEAYEDYLKANNKSFSSEGINALIDLSNSVIALGENASEYDFIEEAAHLGVALMPEDTKFKRALDLVVDTEAYKKNVEGYTELYKKLDKDISKQELDKKVKKEILGKLVADNIITNQKEGISFRLFRTLKSLWNNILGIFNSNIKATTELNNYLKSISDNILNSPNSFVSSVLNDSGIYFSTTEEKEARKVLNNVIEVLENRLKSLQRRTSAKKTFRKASENIDKLKSELERAEEEQGLLSFLTFVKEDVRQAQYYIEQVKAGDKELTSALIRQLQEFLDYYIPLLREIKKKNNYEPLFTNFSEERQEGINNIIVDSISNLENIEDFYNDMHNEAAKNIIKDVFNESGNEIDFDLDAVFTSLPKDANSIEYWGMPLRDLSSPIARSIYALVAKTKQNINTRVNEIGRNLINSVINNLGVKNTKNLAEIINGKATGFFKTRYKLGEFYKEREEFFQKLADKYNLSEGQREPYDELEAIKYRKEKDTWLLDNTERIYNKEYYEIYNNLSEETRYSLQFIDAQRNNIINKSKDENNNIDYFLLNEQELEELDNLNIARRSLFSRYYEDGSKKVGKDLEIAEELILFNERLKGKRKFSVKEEEFEKARRNAQQKYSEEDYKKWLDNNSQKEYDEAFWNSINELEKRTSSIELQDLYDLKSELLKPYQNQILEADIKKVPESILNRVRELDREINTLSRKKHNTGDNKDFWKIAETEKTQQFKKMEKAAKDAGKIKEFKQEHYYKDSKGREKVYSYATHIVPKNKAYIKTVSKWKELSKDSDFYNQKYDPSWIGIQPSDKWLNPEFNNLTANEKEALDILIKLKQEQDSKLPLGTKNAYMLPQISKSINDYIQDKGLSKENLKELLSDTFQSKVDDDEFGMNDSRLDGSIRRYVPTYYTRMLENPDNVSLDIVSSVIKYSQMATNYEEMSKIAPDIEVVKEEFGKVKYQKDNVSKPGISTNIYKMIETFVNMQVYGVSKEGKADVVVPLINKKVNVNKIANGINSYIRANNLMLNFFTMGAGYISGIVNSKIEDLLGRYTTSKSKVLANKEFIKQLPNAIREFKAINKSTKLNVLLEHFRVMDSFDEIFDNLDKDKIKRITKGDVVYFGYGLADYNLKANIALAVMFNYRWYNGKFYTEANFKRAKKNNEIDSNVKYQELDNIYDMFKVKDHKLVVKDAYKDMIKKKDLDYLEYTMRSLSTKADGTLSQIDKAKIHQSTWGQLVATHRNWLIDGISRRWKAKSRNLITGEIEVGYHREFLGILKDTIMSPERLQNMKKLFTEFNELEPHQKEALLRSLFEIMAVATLAIIAKVVNNLSDDDDDNWPLEASAYLMNRVLLETSALSLTPTPVPYSELLTVLNSPVAGSKQIQNLLDITELFNGDEVTKGPYEGFTKREKMIMKMIPGVKGSMSLRDPSATNQFLKYTALKWLY